MAGTPSNDLNISQSGYVVFDGVATFTGRTFQAGTGITISNPNGTGGNTTISLTGGGIAVEHLTGNTGGALNPDGSNNFNTLGTGSITISGSGSTLTTQLTGLTNHAVLIGAGTATITKVGPTATSGQVLQSAGAAADPEFSTATYPSTTTINQLLYSSSANTVAGLATANRGVLTTGATGIPIVTALATDGQLIIGSTAGAPAAAVLTPGAGISITNGSNSISIAVSGTGVGQTITGDSGGALSPTAGNWNLLGSGSITTSGTGSTLTTQLTGLTNHNVLIGAGTTTITKVAPSATSGIPLISQGAAADPTFGTAVVAGGGTGQVTLTNHGVLIGQGTSAIAQTAAGSAGQVLQSGGASADPVYSTATYPATAGTSGNVLTSNGTNFVSQAPAAPSGYQISVFLGGGGQTVVDNTTYFFQTPWTAANGTSWINTEATGRFFIPKNGTITSAYVAYYNKVSNGTAETSTVSIRLNDTSDTTISASVVNNATSAVFSNTGLSISVSQGDFITVKWVSPTWVTNPVGMVSQINIFVS